MVGKNNKKLLREKQSNKVYKYAIKRLTFGVASVAISAGLMFAGGTIASAAEEALVDGAATEEISAPETELEENDLSGSTDETFNSDSNDGTSDIDVQGEPVTFEQFTDHGLAEEEATSVKIQFTEAQKARLREAGYTDEQIGWLEEEATTHEVTDVDAFVEQKVAANRQIQTRSAQTTSTESELELSEETEKEAVGAEEEKNEAPVEATEQDDSKALTDMKEKTTVKKITLKIKKQVKTSSKNRTGKKKKLLTKV